MSNSIQSLVKKIKADFFNTFVYNGVTEEYYWKGELEDSAVKPDIVLAWFETALTDLLSKERTDVINECIKVAGTHEEGEELSYCDTGADMEMWCRSDCMKMAIDRLNKLIQSNK